MERRLGAGIGETLVIVRQRNSKITAMERTTLEDQIVPLSSEEQKWTATTSRRVAARASREGGLPIPSPPMMSTRGPAGFAIH
jgi:hypothetical protein